MPLGWIAGAAVVGAGISAYGSMSAANTQADAQKNAAAQQYQMFNTIQGQEQPYMAAGNQATSRLSDLLGTSGNQGASGYGSLTSNFTPQDYLNNQDPGYQFRLQTGAQATRNADTPGVGSLSGAALKDLTTFNQGMAATGYQNAFSRYQAQNTNTYNRLTGLATLGQNAASNTGAQGTTLAGNAGSATAAAGGSLASGTLGATNAASGAANTLGGLMYLNGPSGMNTGNMYGNGATAGLLSSSETSALGSGIGTPTFSGAVLPVGY
jgi:hypothetical protein